nr:DUF6273 domain-containing protein [Eubacterium sp.]
MRRLILIFLITILTVCSIIAPGDNHAETININPPDYDPLDHSATWDCIYFGKYWQNSNTEKEPIKWRVLSVNGNDACILSDKILDRQPYTYGWGYNTIWKNSYARKWLNEVFYKEAFDESERAAIIEREYEAGGAFGGRIKDEPTVDRITIPKYGDIAEKETGFFWARDDMKRSNRAAKTTKYVGNGKEAYAEWYLRRRGKGVYKGALEIMDFIDSYGEWSNLGICGIAGYVEYYRNNDLYVKQYSITLRPIMHIDLSKGGWIQAESYSSYQESRENSETADYIPSVKYVIKKPSIKKPQRTKKKVKLSWKKTDDATSYTLWYSTSKSFSKKKTKKINLCKTSYTIKKLKKRKKYYVKV